MEALADRLREQEDFELDVTHVALSGRCARCREADRSAAEELEEKETHA
jgi:Fur family ferric uptake transcriptional regulator